MNVNDPFKGNERLPKALRRRVEDNWRRKRTGARPKKVPPVVEEDQHSGRAEGS